MENKLEINLVILDMINDLMPNDEGNVDVLDIVPIAIEIGDYNQIYNNGYWSDDERADCYNKVYELINSFLCRNNETKSFNSDSILMAGDLDKLKKLINKL